VIVYVATLYTVTMVMGPNQIKTLKSLKSTDSVTIFFFFFYLWFPLRELLSYKSTISYPCQNACALLTSYFTGPAEIFSWEKIIYLKKCLLYSVIFSNHFQMCDFLDKISLGVFYVLYRYFMYFINALHKYFVYHGYESVPKCVHVIFVLWVLSV